MALANICPQSLGCYTFSSLSWPQLPRGTQGIVTRCKSDHVYALFKTFQWLCIAQRIKCKILNMTYERLSTIWHLLVSLASSPKHVALKFLPLLCLPCYLWLLKHAIFFLSPWMVLSPLYAFPPGLSYPRESSHPIFIIPWERLWSQSYFTLGTTLIHSSLFTILWIRHWPYHTTGRLFFHLLLSYFSHITENSLILNISASVPSVWVPYKPRASPGLSPQSYW